MRPILAAVPLAADDEPNPLLPHWSEIILLLVVFGVLVWAIRKFVMPKFEQVYAERTEAIEGGIKRAEQAQAEAQEALQHYNEQLADARGEANQIREEARAEARQILEEMRARAQAEADRIQQRGEEQLAAQRRQVISELRNEIGQLSVQLAGRVVGESLEDEARRRGTVDRFLDDLDGMAPHEPDPVQR
ncbi:MAG TPA: F0F1 ATP synthase subunit B [Mycobacteriales bacterium]|nr:F0F1 ATP synthase subunit B [Mycobacteriales bacterium]